MKFSLDMWLICKYPTIRYRLVLNQILILICYVRSLVLKLFMKYLKLFSSDNTESMIIVNKATAFTCPAGDNDATANMYADPANCAFYYQCSGGIAYHMPCPDGLHFNARLLTCDYPQNAGCTGLFIHSNLIIINKNSLMLNNLDQCYSFIILFSLIDIKNMRNIKTHAWIITQNTYNYC